MNRRSFLKAALGALAALTLPLPRVLPKKRIILTEQTFCPGIWAGMEGAHVDVFDIHTGIVRATSRITSVDIDCRLLTVEKPVRVRAGDGVTFTRSADRCDIPYGPLAEVA